jgi:hypothetical protein
MKKLFFVLVLIFIFLFSFKVVAHSGRTDSEGGHYNHFENEYHYHHGYPAHDHPNGECPYLKNNNKNDAKENNKIGFWGALVMSVFIGGWFGGAFLLAILFFPLSLFFKNFFEERLGLIHLICSILTATAMFVYVYVLN